MIHGEGARTTRALASGLLLLSVAAATLEPTAALFGAGFAIAVLVAARPRKGHHDQH